MEFTTPSAWDVARSAVGGPWTSSGFGRPKTGGSNPKPWISTVTGRKGRSLKSERELGNLLYLLTIFNPPSQVSSASQMLRRPFGCTRVACASRSMLAGPALFLAGNVLPSPSCAPVHGTWSINTTAQLAVECTGKLLDMRWVSGESWALI